MSSQFAQEKTSIETAQKLGLLPEEFQKISEILGRTPNFTELSIFSVMWSEHCSYKNSIVWLKTLPKEGKHLLAKAGEENAGLVDIGNGLACAFKIESHNHPSAVEPYQGAATGVGGINRDIFTMGARPIAQLNSLRFGNIHDTRTQWLIKGVVKGIGDYGNAFGVATVAGEVFFDDCYNQNPLVNAMSVGIVNVGETISAISYGKGNTVFIVGSATGKDGIHGATFASSDLTQDSAEDLPSVQVGDPFQEKLLLEATLEVIKTGAVVGMQDMGAAGIICSTSEMSAKGEHGMKIWLDKVPTRQKGMKPFEILLSESQERMLIVVKNGQEDIVKNVFDKWDLNCEQIGEVTETKNLEFYFNNELVAHVPAHDLVLGGGAPVYHREYTEPKYFSESKKFDINNHTDLDSIADALNHITSHENIVSKNWVYEQYDSMVGTNNRSTNQATDAAIVLLKNSDKALAVTVDCNSRYVNADPEIGCAIAVAEAARNITCSGAEPSAITNCLNFGNPYHPEVYWQFVGAIKGMTLACNKFQTPVTGGNVSFYNQYSHNNTTLPVFPTPTIGMLGIVENKENITGLSFTQENSLLYLIGKSENCISSSQYLYSYLKIKLSPAPYFNIDEEFNVHQTVKQLIKNKLVLSAHDCADGGLINTLLESAYHHKLGFDVKRNTEFRKDAFWFGEAQGRVVVSVAVQNQESFESLCKTQQQQFFLLGKTTSQNIIVDNENLGSIELYKNKWQNTLSNILN
jgi:phosphoribosylformylglycinamidine synthase subunit PurL